MPLLDQANNDPFTTRKKNQIGSGVMSLSPQSNQSDWAKLGTGQIINDGTDQSPFSGSKVVDRMRRKQGFGLDQDQTP